MVDTIIRCRSALLQDLVTDVVTICAERAYIELAESIKF